MNDFKDIPGNEYAKRALEVAAAGKHTIALIGEDASTLHALWEAAPRGAWVFCCGLNDDVQGVDMYLLLERKRQGDYPYGYKGEASVEVEKRIQAALHLGDITLSRDCVELLKAFKKAFNPNEKCEQVLIRVARTIANLDNKKRIGIAHLAEACQYVMYPSNAVEERKMLADLI